MSIRLRTRSSLRLIVASLVCLSLLPSTINGESHSFITKSTGVDVVCRADSTAYVTMRLRSRQKVTAYHQQNGFLAIRPPKGSHSWVPMHHVQRSSNPHIGIVIQSGASSYVASGGDKKNIDLYSSVQLKRGERVHILGVESVQLKRSGRAERCFKIAPPPGEFRWLAISDVNGPVPKSLPKLITNVATNRLQRPSEPSAVDNTNKTSSVKQASTESAPDAPMTQPTKTSSLAMQKMDRVADLQIVVTQTVLQPIENWDLESIRDRTIDRVRNGSTALERGQARLLLERIDRFRAAQERWFNQSRQPKSIPTDVKETPMAKEPPMAKGQAQTGGTQSGVSQASFVSPTTPVVPTGAIPSSKTTGGQPVQAPSTLFETEFVKSLFGAAARPALVNQLTRSVGYLVEVRYDNTTAKLAQSMPKFAIVDKNQQVQQFIVPVPGLNLYGFRNQRVSVGGNFIRVKGFDKPILVVENIARLRK